MSHHHGGIECHIDHHESPHHHIHEHDHTGHRLVKGIGHACLEGACGHAEHTGGITLSELHALEHAMLQSRAMDINDDDDEEDETTLTTKRKKTKKFQPTHWQYKAA